MIEGYITVNEAANKWEVNTRTVQIMCADGRIEGAVKFGRDWAIPVNAKRPSDNRVTSGEYRNWRNKTKTDTSQDIDGK